MEKIPKQNKSNQILRIQDSEIILLKLMGNFCNCRERETSGLSFGHLNNCNLDNSIYIWSPVVFSKLRIEDRSEEKLKKGFWGDSTSLYGKLLLLNWMSSLYNITITQSDKMLVRHDWCVPVKFDLTLTLFFKFLNILRNLEFWKELGKIWRLEEI